MTPSRADERTSDASSGERASSMTRCGCLTPPLCPAVSAPQAAPRSLSKPCSGCQPLTPARARADDQWQMQRSTCAAVGGTGRQNRHLQIVVMQHAAVIDRAALPASEARHTAVSAARRMTTQTLQWMRRTSLLPSPDVSSCSAATSRRRRVPEGCSTNGSDTAAVAIETHIVQHADDGPRRDISHCMLLRSTSG